MDTTPTVRVKTDSPGGFLDRNAGELKYGDELFIAEEFEKLGEHSVRLKIEELPSGNMWATEALVWLDIKDKERAAALKSERTAREIETISIAKEANAIARSAEKAARRASRYALAAVILSAIVAIINIYLQTHI